MKLKVRHRLATLFSGVFLLICASIGIVSFAQNLEGFVVEGESFDSIMIGESTADDVVSSYGNKYKLIKHGTYSYEMIYKNLGLAFYYCQDDPDKEIFVVEIEPPSKAVTSKGIKLGESTMADVLRIYGEQKEGSDGFKYESDSFEYEKEGIYFYYEEETDDEDSEDARTQATAEITDKKTENTNLKIDDKSGSESDFVREVPTIRADAVTSNTLEFEPDEIENAKTTAQQDKELAELKKKVVKRIELIEKGELRQCGSKFPKK